MTPVILTEPTVIPSERSESRDLHLSFTRRRGQLPRTREPLCAQIMRTGVPLPSIHDPKVFNGPEERSLRSHAAIRSFPHNPA